MNNQEFELIGNVKTQIIATCRKKGREKWKFVADRNLIEVSSGS